MRIKLLSETWVTLVGVGGKYPLDHGNCFSAMAEDDKEYKVVNFCHENLTALLRCGLTWPIDAWVLAAGGSAVVIDDVRIPELWYQKDYCSVCCPQLLLTEPQRMRIKREIARGERVEQDKCTTIHFAKHPKIGEELIGTQFSYASQKNG